MEVFQLLNKLLRIFKKTEKLLNYRQFEFSK